tara:strand:+ start:888 stop:1340 length:453 start_codon:yes stop_codon:yes gene_type:complete
MTIEKKGPSKLSADKTDKAIRKFVLDNPVLTRTQSVIDKIDRAKKKGTLPIKKNKGGEMKDLPSGLRKDTTTSAYGDAGRGRSVPEFLKDSKPKRPPIRTRPGQNPKGKNAPILERAPKELSTRRKKMKEGGLCRGAGAAIKGTKFEGVF